MRTSANARRSKAALSLALGLCLGNSASIFTTTTQASAQSRHEAPTIVMPPALQLAPGAESPLTIQVAPATAVPRRAIVLIRGLPSTVALSEGRLFESGVWGVAAADLSRVKITTTSAATGRSDLSISLVAIDGTLLAEARTSLLIDSAPAAVASAKPGTADNTVYTAATPQDVSPRPAPSAPAKTLSPQQAAQLAGLVQKGDEQMRVGNISAARLLYRHAAENGLAAAALAMAATFDESELQKLPVRGAITADAKQARHWYEKARELGSAEAGQRLQRLGSR